MILHTHLYTEQGGNSPSGQRGTKGLPFLTELVTGRQKRKRANANDGLSSSETPLDGAHSRDWDVTLEIKTGMCIHG